MSRLVNRPSRKSAEKSVFAASSEGKAVAPPDIKIVLDILESQWGEEAHPDVVALDEPLDGLILTVLSQNTNDKNRDMGYHQLRERHGSWDQIAGLDQETVADAIRPAGISNIKSATILRVLKNVKERFGEYSLKSLRGSSREEAWNFLTNLQGVGPKTAAVVFVFDLGFPAFPVDTHVSRLCRRLGWAEEKESPAAIQERMEQKVPDYRKGGAHLNMIKHGRMICKARGPLCPLCPLRVLCPSSNS